MNKKGQMGMNAVEIAVGVILLVILVLGVGYQFVKTQASPTALGINSDDPEYTLVTYLPLFIVLIVFLGFIGYLYVKNR
jgi:uncharacterized BrkB/YihY/UPF0761 family membrane protein